jgi:hypothetical protein
MDRPRRVADDSAGEPGPSNNSGDAAAAAGGAALPATAAPSPLLPVIDPVTDYEKLHRIGEGTYGVVCTFFLTLLLGSTRCLQKTPKNSHHDNDNNKQPKQNPQTFKTKRGTCAAARSSR